MFCPNCGAKNERGAKKCINCGKPLPVLTETGDLAGFPAPAPAATAPSATEPFPGVAGPRAGSPGSQYSFSNQPQAGYVPYGAYAPPPGYAPYYNYSLPVDRVGVAQAEIGFWPRLGAYFIDNIILSFISGIIVVLPLIAYVVGFISRHQAELTTVCDSSAYGYSARACNQVIDRIMTQGGELGGFVFIVAGLSLLSAIISVLYYSILTARNGATVGKKVFGMRVVTADGQPVGFGRALLRHTVGYLVSSLFFGLGFIWIGFDPHKQGWHDKIAGTYVVRAGYETTRQR